MRRLPNVRLVGGIVALAALAVTVDAGQTRSAWDGIYTDTQARRGKDLYHDACESCHAPDLSGGKVVPAVIGESFTAKWSELTVGKLFERVLVTMPVDDPSRVGRDATADIVAFILRVNGFPAGDRELPERTEILDQLAFEAVKP